MIVTVNSMENVDAAKTALEQYDFVIYGTATADLFLIGAPIAFLAIIAVTTIGFLQRIFDTVELNFAQWSICIGLAASLVVVEELIKLAISNGTYVECFHPDRDPIWWNLVANRPPLAPGTMVRGWSKPC